MKRYTWDEIYERADGSACGSQELKAKDHARYELQQLILQETGADIETEESPEEAIDQYLEGLWQNQGKHIMFDESGNRINVEYGKALQDIFIYVPASNQIVRIAEGSGDNLLSEDQEEGYVNYLYYEQYSLEQDMPEEDGGMILMKMLAVEKYETLVDAIPDILDIAYSDSELRYVVLSPE